MAKTMKALGLNYPTNPAAGEALFGSTVRYAKHNLGATTTMNTWGPSTSHDQASFANLWIANGPMDLFYAVFT
ncbi:hypothetical protein V6N12_010665 [Hibiscus sabdariffa]|uniref:Uncharacterized protein n=1 Tax=Hibiscus sabdariffa TaxID=183260 RepID=A0ABR2EPJ5_9ROSI